MNKESLVKAIATDSGLTQKDATKALASLETIIIKTLATGEEIKLIGLMSVKPVARAARKGRNPADGSAVDIAAKVDVFIKPGKALRAAVAKLKYEDFREESQ
jgi:DNA-binding protein HU-beta